MDGSSTSSHLTRPLFLGAAAVGAAVTLAALVLPTELIVSRQPALHATIETTAALVALLVAYLMWGRFRLSGRLGDLLLIYALGLFAGRSLLLSALPAFVGTDAPVGSGVGRVLSAAALAAAALAPDRRVPSTRRGGLVLVAGWVGGLGATWAARALFLPAIVGRDEVVRAGEALSGEPMLLMSHLAATALFGVAAVSYRRRADRTADPLLAWVTAGAVLGMFAQVNYLLFPTLYASLIYTGDVLRVGFYLLLVVGASREITAYWQDRAAAGVLEERRRMARDLHDGLAQELAFIAAQTRRLTRGEQQSPLMRGLSAAAERALDESRRAIAALTRPIDEAFDDAIAREAESVGARVGADVLCELASDVRVDPEVRETLLRIVREAVTNAARHGRASEIVVSLQNADGVRLRITDDGVGFDPEQANGGFGLVSMRERAEALGATLRVLSSPGGGTTVDVTLP